MDRPGRARHLVTPRTLLLLRRGGLLLLLEGGPSKWFAGRLNGLGGSVEPGEEILAAAAREAEEECGLRPTGLELGAVLHRTSDPPVLLFVFTGELPEGELRPTPEGRHVWADPARLADLPLVPDLRDLIPRVLARPPGAPPTYR